MQVPSSQLQVGPSSMRVPPRPWLGLVALVVYLAIIVLIQGTSGIPYTQVAASAENIWRSGVLSIAVASLALAALATWWGWWRPALFERPTTTRRWTIIAPVLILLLAVVNLLFTKWGNVTLGFLVAGLALGVLVGFGEEFATRGLLLVGLRGRLREIFVWIITCVLFGCLHGVNIVLGAPASSTLFQVLDSAAAGSVFYIVRRVTGSLIWAMALHGLWDFSLFVAQASGGTHPFIVLSFVINAAGVVLGFFATKDAPSLRTEAPSNSSAQTAQGRD